MDTSSRKAIGSGLEKLTLALTKTYDKCQSTLENSEAARAANSETINRIRQNVVNLGKQYRTMVNDPNANIPTDIGQNSSKESVDSEIMVDVVSNDDPPLTLFDSIANGNVPAENQNETNWGDISSSSNSDEEINNTKIEPINNIKTEPIDNIKIESINNIKVEPIDNIKIESINNIKTEPINNTKVEPTNNIKTEPIKNIKIEPINNTETAITKEKSSNVIAVNTTTEIKIKSKKLTKKKPDPSNLFSDDSDEDYLKNRTKKNASDSKITKKSQMNLKDSEIKYQSSLDLKDEKIVLYLKKVNN